MRVMYAELYFRGTRARHYLSVYLNNRIGKRPIRLSRCFFFSSSSSFSALLSTAAYVLLIRFKDNVKIYRGPCRASRGRDWGWGPGRPPHPVKLRSKKPFRGQCGKAACNRYPFFFSPLSLFFTPVSKLQYLPKYIDSTPRY